MFYHNITSDDMLNGDGLRVVLWVAGCQHACPNCHNPSTWDAQSGIPFTEWDEAEFWEKLSQEHINGCTFSGGDPLHPANRDTIGRLADAVKKLYPNKDIWLYTGYKLDFDNSSRCWIFRDDVINLAPFSIDWIESIDVIVDGRYVQKVREEDIHSGMPALWRGSSNQNVIDVKKSLSAGRIVSFL